MAHLVHFPLPLRARDGSSIPQEHFRAVQDELTERHGGLTAFTRAPAEGRWKNPDDQVEHDDVVIFEVIDRHFDRDHWRCYRTDLERRFDQEEIVIRVHEVDLI